MGNGRVLWAAALAVLAAVALSACGGGSKSKTPPPDPVTMALQAPGIRAVIVPKQSNALTVVVPPCSTASLRQSSTRTPPGSNQIVVPKSAVDQTVAIQPCIVGGGMKNAEKSSTVLLSPGGAGSPQTQKQGQPENQLLLPSNSNLSKIIVPPCVVQVGSSSSASSSSSSSSGAGPSAGTTITLPATRNKTTVTAPPCSISMVSSSSSSGG